MKCDIELFWQGRWHTVAVFQLLSEEFIEKGYKGSGHLEYDIPYATKYLGSAGITALSCRYPVNFEIHKTSSWPAFLLDILPSGANRRIWLNRVGITDGPDADWQLLLAGGGNPPGNIRIAQAAPPEPLKQHEGFSRDEVIERAENFIEYAMEYGAPVAGSTGAQGDAPKFLLTQDHNGRFHADGALPDRLAAKHWIVKFPRGKQESDRTILRNESAYFRVARAVGIYVGEDLDFQSNTLFVPRFDREIDSGKVLRFGLESLCSVAGVADFGMNLPMENLCKTIAEYSSEPFVDIREFVFRDILNVALGNTDNHARNSSMIKYIDGTVRLAPLYDFAPMFLDDQGIPRACRWSGLESAGYPDWGNVAEVLAFIGMDPIQMRSEMAAFGGVLRKLPEIMEDVGVDEWLIERLMLRISEIVKSLLSVRPKE